MKSYFNALLIVIIIALIIMIVIDMYSDYIKENYKDVIEKECKIYNIFHKDFCHSKFANYGQIQILKAYNDSTETSEKEMLKTVYDLKKTKNMFNVPCIYVFDNLKEIDKNNEQNFYEKKIDPTEDIKNLYNEPISWARCYYDVDYKGPLPNNAQENAVYIHKNRNEIVFADMNDSKLTDFVCNNKTLFYKEKDLCCIYLKIQCSVLTESPLDIAVNSIRVVEYKDGKFEIIETMEKLNDFFTISYDDKRAVYIPLAKEYDYCIFMQDLCGNKRLDEKRMDIFHMNMCGVSNILLTDAINGLGVQNAPGIYPYESDKSITIEIRRQELLNEIERIEKGLVDTKVKEFKACSQRYLQTMNNIQGLKGTNKLNSSDADNYLSEYSSKILEIESILQNLNTYKMYYNDNTGCDNNVDNRALLTLLKNRYMDCSRILGENNLSTDALDKFIKRAGDIIADSNYEFALPETFKQELITLINNAKSPETNKYCSINNTVNLQTSKIMVENARTYVKEHKLNDSILATLDNLNLRLDQNLVKYISFDNAIYVKITPTENKNETK